MSLSKFFPVFAVAMLFAAASISLAGTPARVSNTEHYIGALPPSSPGYTLQPLFASAPFGNPESMAVAPDGSGWVYVGLRNGTIQAFNLSNPSGTLRQALGNRGFYPAPTGSPTWDEVGILGMTCHPNFATNGYIYIYEVYSDGGNQLTDKVAIIKRFTVTSPGTINAASSLTIFEHADDNLAHMGGGLKFGPDGYLYFSYGDGRNFCSTIANLQTERGKIFRIDVDGGTPYAIPPTNPRASDPVLPEYWAHGFRNPFRFSFDSMTGDLYLGDVGDRRWEEINLITPGADYGWPRWEGEMCHIFTTNDCMDSNEGNCTGVDPNDYVFPILKRQWDPDKSMTVGYAYYGNKFPELYGMFLYGDYTSTRFAAFTHNGTSTVEDRTLIPATGIAAVNIEPGPDGEPILLDFGGGNIYTLERAPIGTTEFPLSLSQAPWLIELANLGTIDGQPPEAGGVMPYTVNSRLWSDFAEKTRYLALPNLSQVGYRPDDGYDMPTSTTIIKNFYLEISRGIPTTRKLIETRLLVKHTSGWAGYTYEWNDDETDASLVEPDGKFRGFVITELDGVTTRVQTWLYPSRGDCFQCHTSAQNIVLGLETAQLNRDFNYVGGPANQLERWEAMGIFSAPLPAAPASLPALVNPLDSGAPLESRARAYVHANCSMCHQIPGPTNVGIDMRYFIDRAAMELIDVPATSNFLPGLGLIPDLDRIKSGDETLSAVYLRITGDGTAEYRMPPLARFEVDPEGTAVIRDWIRSLGTNSATDPAWLLAH